MARNTSIIVLLFTFISSLCFCENYEIGKIDLAMALTLHPKMSLFDYNRLGFYKVDIGLTDEDFYQKVFNLREKAQKRSNIIKNMREQIKDLGFKLNTLPKSSINYKENIDKILTRINELKEEIEKIEIEDDSTEITNFKETQTILSSINKEVNDCIKEIAKEQKLKVIFNDSIPIHNVFPLDYEQRNAFYRNSTNLSFNYYHIFLTESLKAKKEDNLPSSEHLSNWLEQARFPQSVSILPMNSQSLVLAGAKDILKDVLSKIYTKYGINKNILKNIELAITELKNRKGYSYED